TFAGGVIGRRERHENDVPLRRDIPDRAVAGPVANQLVAVGTAGHGHRLDRVRGRRRRSTERSAAASPGGCRGGGFGGPADVRKAVGVLERRRGSALVVPLE